MRYRWTIEFEAEDDEEAKEVVYGKDLGAREAFSDIHDERLEALEDRGKRKI